MPCCRPLSRCWSCRHWLVHGLTTSLLKYVRMFPWLIFLGCTVHGERPGVLRAGVRGDHGRDRGAIGGFPRLHGTDGCPRPRLQAAHPLQDAESGEPCCRFRRRDRLQRSALFRDQHAVASDPLLCGDGVQGGVTQPPIRPPCWEKEARTKPLRLGTSPASTAIVTCEIATSADPHSTSLQLPALQIAAPESKKHHTI